MYNLCMDKVIGIYVRVSTKDQNTELQLREINKYIHQLPANYGYAVYEDYASGTNTRRPELARLLYDAEHGSLDKIVVWKLDRFFRSLKDLIDTLHKLSRWGVDFVSIKDQIDLSTPSGRLMMHMLAAFAEFEASLIRERVKSGLANAKEKGVKLGREKTRNSALIRELHSQGYSQRKIAALAGCSATTVNRELKLLRKPELDKNGA